MIGATVLLGTGAGIAFFMLISRGTGDAANVAALARIVVIADFVFTATTVIAQPITGVLLARPVYYSLHEGCLARVAAAAGEALPAACHRLLRSWFAFGRPCLPGSG